MPLSENDLNQAHHAIQVLRSDKYSTSMYMFLTPFDASQVPGYMDVVQKKLDLQTVEENLLHGNYDTIEEFWSDLKGIFDNAILYHSHQPDTNWIAKLARDILKVVQREYNKAGGGKGGNPTKKIKIKLSKSATKASLKDEDEAVLRSEATTSKKAGATTLKLKLPMSHSAATSSSSLEANPVAESSELTGTLSTVNKSTSSGPKKLKLKLSLARPKQDDASQQKSEEVSISESAPTTLPPAPLLKSDPSSSPSNNSNISTSSPSKLPKLTLKLGQQPQLSRGKELPKGVTLENNNKKKKSIVASNHATTTPTAMVASSSSSSVSTSGKLSTTLTTTPLTLAATATNTASTSSTTHTTVTITKSKKKKIKIKNTNFPIAAATKVILGIRRRSKGIAWFLQPVSDKAILADYRAKIHHPIDVQTIASKLERAVYPNLAAFVLDLRRIVANCLAYNTSIKDSLRPVAVELMDTIEKLLRAFLKPLSDNHSPISSPPPASAPTSGKGGHSASSNLNHTYPPLLYCWKLCVGVLDTLYNLVNPEDGQPTVLYFLHPVSVHCGGSFPPDYKEKISKPMDFGTATANLLEGKYKTIDEFTTDCRLVLSNTLTYYQGREDGRIFIDQASRLNEVLLQQTEQLNRYAKSSRGLADQLKASSAASTLMQPPIPVLLAVLDELRSVQYTDKATKITESAMVPFEKPVSHAAFPDYTQHVDYPMDLQTVERKVKSHSYATPEDFEYDVNLVFKNSELYNSKRDNGDHLVTMAKFGVRQFRKIYYAHIRAFEDPSNASQSSMSASQEQYLGNAEGGGASNRNTIALGEAATMGAAVARAKSAPRISITAAQVTSAAMNAARAESPANAEPKKSQPVNQMSSSSAASNPNPLDQPVPLHIAIARVKEAFPIRRPHKQLQPWEADCARYFKELMRHPWISAARPKFIFNVPVPTLFPELREVYASKIRKPMDLTTVECTLLQGNRYTQPDDVLQDVALVFTNAIRFNKDGRDIGDPLSCAYYDASVHLLRYSRWLSLEILQQYIDSSSDAIDEGALDGLPPVAWKLTEGNSKRAREEMEKLVMNEPIDKSLEGDRYSWHEVECEKLLKALRHQSDLKYMTFFIQASYPADYTAFISKPMDWEKVQRTLKKRQYDKLGDVMDDLRLIFTNALKYNSRLKGTDTVSGRAYEAAKYMSSKLESAISKCLLAVSDRLERERIDHNNAERELESMEQVEEAQIREAWKHSKESGVKDAASRNAPLSLMSSGSHSSNTGNSADDTDTAAAAADRIRGRSASAYHQQLLRQREKTTTTDFEIPYFDEDNVGGHIHEHSYVEYVQFQKRLFEKQRRELLKLRHACTAIGVQVLTRHVQHKRACLQRSHDEREKEEEEEQKKRSSSMIIDTDTAGETFGPQKSCQSSSLPPPSSLWPGMAGVATTGTTDVWSELERDGREPVKLTLATSAKTKAAAGGGRKRKAMRAFDWSDSD